jgi:hypothetical protein
MLMNHDTATTQPIAKTLDSLAERLRDGPLRTLLTLHVRAGMLAGDIETDDGQRLEKLVELVELARVAMAQFHDFTLEVQSLVDHLSAAARDNVQ